VSTVGGAAGEGVEGHLFAAFIDLDGGPVCTLAVEQPGTAFLAVPPIQHERRSALGRILYVRFGAVEERRTLDGGYANGPIAFVELEAVHSLITPDLYEEVIAQQASEG
jgi:hypothetical protein